MKKIIALLLAVAMMFSLAACAKTTPDPVEPDTTSTPDDQKEEFKLADSYEDPDVYGVTLDGGSFTTTAASGSTGMDVNKTVYAGTPGKDYTDEAYYTFNDYMAGMGSGLDWNPHTWETNDDSVILDFITMGLYTFALNEDKTGYSVIPEMAADYAVDVTAEYVGSYGVQEGEKAKAFRIALNPNACWDDANHTPITADDYIYSMQQQLNPYMLNRRADSYYAGDFEIVAAKRYLYSAGGDSYDKITDLAAALAAGEVYIDMWNFWGLQGCVDADGNECPQYVAISDEVKYRDVAVEEGQDEDWVSGKYIYEAYLQEGAAYNSYATEYMYTKAANFSYEPITDLASAVAAGEVYIDMWNFWGLEGCVDANGNECPQYVAISNDVMYRDVAVEEGQDEDWVSGKYIYETYLQEGAPYTSYATDYMFVQAEAQPATWDDVGLKKIDDYTIDVILARPMEEANFYLPYNLSSNWLVYKPLYEACKTYWDADGKEITAADAEAHPELVNSITTNYCTSLETSIGYGPYKLTAYELDKQIKLERSESWYGYSDGRHLGQYQCDCYSIQVIEEHKTALLTFLAGDVDGVSLEDADMATYSTSDRLQFTPQDYTTKISFNTDYDALIALGDNAQILTVKEFREAFCYSIDKVQFASAYTAAGTAGFGLLNYQYCYNPFTGALYRESDAAKDALCRLFGLEYGAGKDFESLDEAYDAITGYNIEKANELMQVAYDKAVAAKVYDGESPIVLEFRVYNSDEIYNKMFNFISESVIKATEGTGFEGKLSFKMTPDADYYETMYSGGTSIIFTTWGGAAMAPFTMMSQCYVDASDGSGNQMEIGFRTEDIQMTVKINGTDYTFSMREWINWAGSMDTEITPVLGSFSDLSYESRCDILAEFEYQYLSQFVTFGMYYRNVASLNSRKVENASDSYLQIVGFGGIPFMTFNYNDTEWEAVKASQTY